jgi:DNA-binding MarR family transcriptional regulator
MSDSEPDTDVSAQLRDIATYLIEVAERSQVGDLPTHRKAIGFRKTFEADDLLALAWLAREELGERRRRDRLFNPSLLGEPAWDILLDLFVAKVEARRISVTSACIASNVPPTTALRWLTILIEHELIYRVDDEFDQRRSWVALTEKGFGLLTTYLRKRASEREPQIIGIGRPRAFS